MLPAMYERLTQSYKRFQQAAHKEPVAQPMQQPAAPAAPSMHIPTTPVVVQPAQEHTGDDMHATVIVRRGKNLPPYMAAAHPQSHQTQSIGFVELLHPRMIKYPDAATRFDCPAWQLGLASIKEESFSAYLSSYVSVWNVYSHILAESEDDSCNQFVQAVQYVLQHTANNKLASFRSHLHFFEDLGLIPDLRRKLLKRMIQGDATFGDPMDECKVEHRLLLPAEVLYNNIWMPLCNDSEPCFYKIAVMLAVTTGHHIGESWLFSFCDQVKGNEILVKPFKFFLKGKSCGVWKDASPLFIEFAALILEKFPACYNSPQFFTKKFESEHSFQECMNFYLAGLQADLGIDQKREYAEALTHRILRRTFASILHYLEVPADVIIYLLNHNSRKALKDYVSHLSDGDKEFVNKHKAFFSKLIPVPEDNLDNNLIHNIMNPKPKLFAFKHVQRENDDINEVSKAPKKRKVTDLIDKFAPTTRQCSITEFFYGSNT